MRMLNQKMRKYTIVLSAVLLLVLFNAPSVFAASISETESGTAVEQSNSVGKSGSVENDTDSTEDDSEILKMLENMTLKVEPEDCTYNGKAQTPEVKLIFTDPGTNKETDVTDRFVMEKDYSDNQNVGTAMVSINVTHYYKVDENGNKVAIPLPSSISGEMEATFTIKAMSIESTSVVLEKNSYTYDGSVKKPAVTVTVGGKKLEEGADKDYTVEYSKDCTSAGNKTVTITGKGNYTGIVKKNFTIAAASIKKASVTLKTKSYTYDGSAKEPAVDKVITVNGVNLKSGDYRVAYKNNKNAGTATVTITGKGNYKDSAAVSFTIKPAAISAKTAKLKLSNTSYTYTGKAINPGTTVTVKNTKLTKNKDYTVKYSKNCISAGKKNVKITGIGNYAGTLETTFTVKPRNLSSATISLSTSKYAYNGKDRKPGTTVKIKLSSTVTLKKDTDYTVSYSKNCKSIGVKTVAIKGKGNYTGTIKKTYSVVPEKASGVKVSKRTTSALTVNCIAAKTSGCNYQFLIKQYNSSKKAWENLSSKKTSSNSVTFSGLTAGRAYKVYVRIYKTISSKNYTGAWSSVLTAVPTPAKPVISSAAKTGNKTMKVTWKAVSYGDGYEIQYSTKSDFSSNTKTVKVTGRKTTSKSINLASTNTYYVRVRVYRTLDGKVYRGAWSSKISTAWSNVYASYSTTYNASNTNRSTNLRLACNAINGTILANGATFSFNGIVGERTAAKGYKEAIIYEGGQEVGGIGGGICQVASTIFNAALKANFQIVERYQHSLTVHYVPLGYDAAIAWGSKNLRFKNNSGTSIKVQASASGGTISIKFLTSGSSKPPKVTTKVTARNRVYTLKRYVNGKCNYTTTSKYLDK